MMWEAIWFGLTNPRWDLAQVIWCIGVPVAGLLRLTYIQGDQEEARRASIKSGEVFSLTRHRSKQTWAYTARSVDTEQLTRFLRADLMACIEAREQHYTDMHRMCLAKIDQGKQSEDVALAAEYHDKLQMLCHLRASDMAWWYHWCGGEGGDE